MKRLATLSVLLTIGLTAGHARGPSVAPQQPTVQPGPSEPDWIAILEALYGLSLWRDLLNPVTTTPEAAPGLFRKAGPGEVRFTPVLALGLEVDDPRRLLPPGTGRVSGG